MAQNARTSPCKINWCHFNEGYKTEINVNLIRTFHSVALLGYESDKSDENESHLTAEKAGWFLLLLLCLSQFLFRKFHLNSMLAFASHIHRPSPKNKIIKNVSKQYKNPIFRRILVWAFPSCFNLILLICKRDTLQLGVLWVYLNTGFDLLFISWGCGGLGPSERLLCEACFWYFFKSK